MGWFLSGTKSRSKVTKRKSAKKAKAAKLWDPQRTLAALQVLAALGLLAGVVMGFRRAEASLTNYVQEHEAQRVDTDKVVLVDKPGWMPVNGRLHNALRALVAGQIVSDPLDNASLQRAALALAANPWVKRVDRIQRVAADSVWVYAKYREPLAMVEGEDGYRLVDSEGYRLPGVWQKEEVERMAMPLVTGVSSPTVPQGKLWPGADLQAGLSLVQLLQGEPYLSQIQAFDVSERDGRGRVRLSLKTQSGMVRWGLPPGQEQTVEPDAATKKQWLATVYKRRGQIDAGGRVVDIYGAAVFVHQSETEEPDLTVGYTWSK